MCRILSKCLYKTESRINLCFYDEIKIVLQFFIRFSGIPPQNTKPMGMPCEAIRNFRMDNLITNVLISKSNFPVQNWFRSSQLGPSDLTMNLLTLLLSAFAEKCSIIFNIHTLTVFLYLSLSVITLYDFQPLSDSSGENDNIEYSIYQK